MVTLGKDRSSSAFIERVDFTVADGAVARRGCAPSAACADAIVRERADRALQRLVTIGVSITRDDEATPNGGNPSFYHVSMAYFPTGTSGIPGTLTTQSGSTTTTDTTPFQPSLRATVALGEPRSRTATSTRPRRRPWSRKACGPEDVDPLVLHLTSDCLDGTDNDGDGKVDAADPGCPAPAAPWRARAEETENQPGRSR